MIARPDPGVFFILPRMLRCDIALCHFCNEHFEYGGKFGGVQTERIGV